MGSSPLSLKRVLLLSTLFALGVVAQNDNNNNNNNNNNNKPDDTATQTQNDPAATNTQPGNKPGPPAATKTTDTSKDQPTAAKTDTTSKDKSPPPLTTSTSTSATEPTNLPKLSTSPDAIVTGMPTLPAGADTSVPTYPPPQIPPTHNAPFMNHSTLPDGTVFIAVGAILGAFGVAILAWRGIVACLLHRSVERAAMAQHAANNGRGNDKNAASFPAPPAQFYKYIERESSPSLAAAGLGGDSTGRRTHRGPTPSATPSQTNLFFSPTAAGSSSGLAGNSPGHRDSARFLPSGFYASASSPVQGGGGGGGHVHGNSISMSTLRPSSRGRLGPSPPESPDVGPRVVSRNFSTSSLNLNRPPSPGTRAPSAYLDDLLDEQPGMFPPAAGGGGGGPASPHHPQQGVGSQGRRF